MARVGIVTTLKDAGELIDAFVAHHLNLSFERIFFFFDDPNDPDADRFENHENVTVIRNNEELHSEWRLLARKHKVYRFWFKQISETHLPVRKEHPSIE